MKGRAASPGAPAFAITVVAVLALGSASAFSPAMFPRATTTMRYRSVHGCKSMPVSLRSPLHMSKIETAEKEVTGVKKKDSTEEEISMVATDREEDKKLNRPTTTVRWAAVAAACALAFLPLQDVTAAASGGRMGGSFSAAPSVSRPAPAVRSSPSSSYSRGYSAGYRSRPAATVAPGYGYGSPFGYGYGGTFSSPFSRPLYSPFAGPRVYGGPGVLAVSRGPSLFDVLVFGGLLFAAAQMFAQSGAVADAAKNVWGDDRRPTTAASPLGPGTSVVQLSVALDVPDRDDRTSILAALRRLSDTARTDSRVGIQNLASQVALEVLRRRASVVAASTSTRHFGNRDRALREFQSIAVRERGKFEAETVSKFGGVDYASPAPKARAGGANSGGATMAVVTLVLAIDGDATRLNEIRSSADVEQALQKIAADAKVGDCLQSAEILWTPEDRSETLGLRDVIADYPELRRI